MIPYVALFGVTAFAAATLSTWKSSRSASVFIALAFACAGFMIAFRSVNVGTDTAAYLAQYQIGYVRHNEMGYTRLIELLRDHGLSFRVLMVVGAGCLVGTVGTAIRRFSASPFLSVIFVLTTGLFAMGMTGMRQTFAVSLFVVATMFLLSGRRLVFVALVLLAATFHNSALVLLPLAVVPRVRLSQRAAFGLLACGCLIATQGGLVGVGLGWLGISRYSDYLDDATAGVNPLVVGVGAAVPVAALLLWPKDRDRSVKTMNGSDPLQRHSFFFVLAVLNLVFVGLATEVPIVTRMSYYFLTFSSILLANSVALGSSRTSKMLGAAGVVSACALMFFVNTPHSSLGIYPYRFYWSGS